MEIVFATNNQNKLEEIRQKIGGKHTILSLTDIGFNEDIPESHETLEENASEKAHHIFNRFGQPCFADDTGLEITALNGRPGVYSARYAGPNCLAEDNMQKVLSELSGVTDRSAMFRTIISLIIDGAEEQFEGTVAGEITEVRSGEDGFGYDPIFIPDGFTKTFAELPLEEKNRISHRGKAVQQLVEYLSHISP